MKTCSKCGRTSPPALAQCPRCKTPFNTSNAATPSGRNPISSRSGSSQGSLGSNKKVILASILAVVILMICMLLFIRKGSISTLFSGISGSGSNTPKVLEKISNFNELLGVWSGREINGGTGWAFIFSGTDSVSVSGPDGSFRGRGGIHWDIGTDGEVMRVPPGAGVLDVDIEESTVGQYKGKTSVGAFSISFGSNMKLCSGEPGSRKRPQTFEPISGIRCFELTKSAEAPPPQSQQAPPNQTQPQQAQQQITEITTVQIPAESAGEVAAAKEAFKNCVASYRAGNINEAKKYIGSKDLPEMEKSGMLDMAMGMMSGLNIDEFTPTHQGNRMIFKKSEKQGDMSSSMSINMVKEDGQWKLGK